MPHSLPVWARVHVEAYLDRLALERRLSPNTVSSYRRDLRSFFAFAAESGVSDLVSIDRRLVRRYIADLSSREFASRSIARRASAVRAFYADAVRRSMVAVNPAEGISVPRIPQSLPRVVPSATLTAALDQLDAGDPVTLRDRAILELLYGCGLRVGELSRLTTRAGSRWVVHSDRWQRRQTARSSGRGAGASRHRPLPRTWSKPARRAGRRGRPVGGSAGVGARSPWDKTRCCRPAWYIPSRVAAFICHTFAGGGSRFRALSRSSWATMS